MRQLLTRLTYYCLIRPWLTLLIGVRYVNTKALRTNKQCIIVANHNSHFDAVSIYSALKWERLKRMRTVVAEEYFAKNPISKIAMVFFFNAFFVRRIREADEESPIHQMDERLKKGDSFILFPEGTRGNPGVVEDFKQGVAILLLNNPDVPFIPVYLDGFGRVLPKDSWFIVPMNCNVRFGEPIFPKGTTVEEVLQEIRLAITNLKDKDERDMNRFAVGSYNTADDTRPLF